MLCVVLLIIRAPARSPNQLHQQTSRMTRTGANQEQFRQRALGAFYPPRWLVSSSGGNISSTLSRDPSDDGRRGYEIAEQNRGPWSLPFYLTCRRRRTYAQPEHTGGQAGQGAVGLPHISICSSLFPLPTMSLRDLVKYISVQEEAIIKLSVLDPEGEDCAQWIPFRDYFLGKDSFLVDEPVERDDKPLKAVPIDPPLTRTVTTIHPSISYYMASRKILVRSEYKEAERAAVLANEPDVEVFVVSGQPGIGLPSPPHRLQNLMFDQENLFFLLYLLMRRLSFKLPTVFQNTPSSAVLFHEGGVARLTDYQSLHLYSPISFPPDEPFRRIWALLDFHPFFPAPALIFGYRSPFYPVCAMSPRSKSTDWLNKLDVEKFYMKPWSILELVQAYVNLTFGGPQHSLSVVAPSSVIGPAQNVNSGICSMSLARLPGT